MASASCDSADRVALWNASITACIRSAAARTRLLTGMLATTLPSLRRPRVATRATSIVGGPSALS